MEKVQFAERIWRTADGLKLYARDYPGTSGSARLPVVCIHGLTRNSRDFEDVVPRIAQLGRRVLVVDIRGRGRSDRDPKAENYHLGTYSKDVADLLDALGIARALFVGTSMGGLITMVVAAERPTLVAGAVLNDVGPQISPAGLSRISGYAGQTVPVHDWHEAAEYARRVNEIAQPGRDFDYWERYARRLFRLGADGRPVLDYDLRVADVVRKGAATSPVSNLWPLFIGLATGRLLLLIRGEISDVVDAPIAARMRAAAPRMIYTEVSKVGHAPMLDESEAAAALEAFFRTTP